MLLEALGELFCMLALDFRDAGADMPAAGCVGIGGALSLFARRYREECGKVNAKVSGKKLSGNI